MSGRAQAYFKIHDPCCLAAGCACWRTSARVASSGTWGGVGRRLGGPDSVALLDCCTTWRARWNWSLVVAMSITGSCGRTAGRPDGQSSSREIRVPFEFTELNLGADTTETTRGARLRVAARRAKTSRREYIVTAHHEDDQVETILLARAGAGERTRRSRRNLRPRSWRVVRPLLPFTRTELLAHVAERGLPVYEDPANRDPRHLRPGSAPTLLPLLMNASAHGCGAIYSSRSSCGQRSSCLGITCLDIVPELALASRAQPLPLPGECGRL